MPFQLDLTHDLGLTSLKKVRIKNVKSNEIIMIQEESEIDGKRNVFTEKVTSDVTGLWSLEKDQVSISSTFYVQLLR